MKKLFFGLRMIISLVLITSGIAKLLDLQSFHQTVSTYGIINENYLFPFVAGISVIETMLGVLLLLNIYPKTISLLLILLMLFFVTFNVYSLLAGKDWVCACFGKLFNTKINYSTTLRDLLLLSISIIVYFKPTDILTFDKFSKRQTWILYASIVIIFLSGVAYNYYNSNNETVLYESKILDELIFESDEGQIINLLDRTEPLLLIIVFSTFDCASCLDEGYFWQELHDLYRNNMKVIAVGHSHSETLINAFKKHKNITFPIYYDKSNRLALQYKLLTPFRILINAKNEVVKIEHSINSKEGNISFDNLIKSLVP